MIGQSSARKITYEETIAKLKGEMHSYIRDIRRTEVWPRLESAYRALVAIEELADDPHTTLEQLFQIMPTDSPRPAQPRAVPVAAALAMDEQQEPEAATELEKGA